MSEKKVDTKEWALEPETEYRFELDPGTSLAIKVCPFFHTCRISNHPFSYVSFSSQKAVPKFLDLNWQKEKFIFSVLNARPRSIHGKDVFLRWVSFSSIKMMIPILSLSVARYRWTVNGICLRWNTYEILCQSSHSLGANACLRS